MVKSSSRDDVVLGDLLNEMHELYNGMSEEPQWTDVVVVGSGFAGLAAALEAGTTREVLILEQMRQPGGNSVMNAGQVAAVNSKQQKAAGIDDSAEAMIDDMLRAGHFMNHQPLLEKLVAESTGTAEWLETIGVKFRERLSHMGGHSVPRTLCTLNSSGRDIIDPMLRKIGASPNITLQTGSAVKRLILGRDDLVQGVILEDGGIVRCRRGVVLAAGGYGSDVAFRKVQKPAYDETVATTNQPGATADALRAALKIGAMPVHLDQIQLGPWTSPDEDGFGKAPLFCIGAGFRYGVIVDPSTGKRFVNEMGNRDERSQAIIQRGHPVICVADATGAAHSLDHVDKLTPAVTSFPTLKAVALHFNMDPSEFQATIDDYNLGVKKGIDVFGKPVGGDVEPLTTPPFYATRLWPKVHHTCGGVQIDYNARVLNVFGRPIPGLFAAGEFVGGVHGADRLGSCATTDCLVFGRLAGKNAALHAPTVEESGTSTATVREDSSPTSSSLIESAVSEDQQRRRQTTLRSATA